MLTAYLSRFLASKTLFTVASLSVVMLSACSSAPTKQTTHSVARPVVHTTPMAIAHTANTLLSCSGLYHCEINSIATTAIINADTHLPAPKTNQAMLPFELKPLPTQGQVIDASKAYPTYAVSFPAGKYLVTMRYYSDDSLNNYENFKFIYQFQPQTQYQLHAYRQVQQTNNSLLGQSAPTPLCIDLYQANTVQKRWCKLPNKSDKSAAEFKEVTI